MDTNKITPALTLIEIPGEDIYSYWKNMQDLKGKETIGFMSISTDGLGNASFFNNGRRMKVIDYLELLAPETQMSVEKVGFIMNEFSKLREELHIKIVWPEKPEPQFILPWQDDPIRPFSHYWAFAMEKRIEMYVPDSFLICAPIGHITLKVRRFGMTQARRMAALRRETNRHFSKTQNWRRRLQAIARYQKRPYKPCKKRNR